jgi:hypothetical protein
MNSYLIHALLDLGLILAGYFAMDWLVAKWNIEHERRSWLARVPDVMIILCILALMVGGWLCAIKESQLRPHVVTTSINGHVLSSVTLTNPEYTTFVTRDKWTTNGLGYELVPVTNYFWTVWSIFKN